MSSFSMESSSSMERYKPVLSLLAPAGLVVLGYLLFVNWVGLPNADAVERNQSDLERLRPVAATPQQVASLTQQREKVQQEVTAAQDQLGRRKADIREICGQTDNAVGRLQLLCSINNVLEQRGLIITEDKVVDNSPRLGGSLSNALKQLANSLQGVEKSGSSSRGVPYIPPGADIPEGLPISDLMSLGQQRLTTELHLRELKAWGTYADMVSAVDAVGQMCGESVIVGVGAERPEGATSELLLWNILVHTQPSPVSEPEPVDQLARGRELE